MRGDRGGRRRRRPALAPWARAGATGAAVCGGIVQRGCGRSDCHTCFSKENQVQIYMHAGIKFHAYSWHKWMTVQYHVKKEKDCESITLKSWKRRLQTSHAVNWGLRTPSTSNIFMAALSKEHCL
jgi:hypothetical protein